MEPRVLLSGIQLLLDAGLGSLDLTLRLDGADLVAINNVGGAVLASQALASTSDVRILGGAEADRVRIDASGGAITVPIAFQGGAGSDTLEGPSGTNTWLIPDVDAGTLAGGATIAFAGVEKLVGAAYNEDTFVFGPGGGLTGTVEGGAGGFDSIVLDGGTFAHVTYCATGPDSGTIDRDAAVITYSGMEPLTDNSDSANRVFTGTAAADQVRVYRPEPGKTTVESNNGSFESVTFADPTESLTIELDSGDDTVSLGVLNGFVAHLTVEGGDGDDRVSVDDALSLPGHNLKLAAESITVASDVTISTVGVGGPSGNITFEARRESTQIAFPTFASATVNVDPGAELLADGSNEFSGGDISITAYDVWHRLFQFSPVEIAHKTASITLGGATDGATLRGRNVTVRAEAADMSWLNELPVYAKGFVGEMMGHLNQLGSIGISQFLGIDASVFIRAADATVDLLGDTLIDATGNVDIEAKSIADASLWAAAVGPGVSPIPFTAAVGYGQSTALTRAAIADTSEIAATGNVTIISDGSAIASVGARTNAQLGNLGPGGLQDVSSKHVSLAFAFASTNLTSTTTVAEGAMIVSREGNVNIDAKGTVTNNPAAWTAQYGDGTGGIAVALGFDHSTVTTQVDGTVQARGVAAPVFDPQALVNVDADTIALQDHGYSTGDRAVYSAGLGTPLGGLEDGGTYTILVVDGDHIQLARGGHIDLDNSAVTPGAEHTVTPFGVVTFAPAAGVVDTDGETLRIDNHGFTQGQLITYAADGVFEKEFEPSSGVVDSDTEVIAIDSHGFVNGDRVLYDSNDSDAVPGLENGKEYEIELDSLPPGDQPHKLKLIDPDDGTVVDIQSGALPEGAHHLVKKATGNPIEGLQPGEQYEVDFTDVTDMTNYLKLKRYDEPVDLLPQDPARPLSTGVHFFAFEDQSAERAFDPEMSVDSDRNTITFSESHGFENGDAIVYRTDPTKGLSGQVVSGNIFELKNFEPSAGAVDAENNTVTIEGHGFDDGDRVFYESNGFDGVAGLLDGKEYEVDLDSLPVGDRADNLKLIDPDEGTFVDIEAVTMPNGTHGLLEITTSDSEVDVADLPVGGLEDGQVYNIIVVDATTIRLTDSYPDAVAGTAVDLADAGSGTAHSLSQGQVEGIGIKATLDATNKAFGGPSVGGSPTWRDLRWNPELVPAVRTLLPWSGADFAKDNGLGGENASKISLGGGSASCGSTTTSLPRSARRRTWNPWPMSRSKQPSSRRSRSGPGPASPSRATTPARWASGLLRSRSASTTTTCKPSSPVMVQMAPTWMRLVWSTSTPS